MQDLIRRLSVLSLLIPCVIAALVFALHPVVQYVVVLLAAGLTAISVWEYEQLAKNKGGKVVSWFLGFMAILEVVAFYLVAKYSMSSQLPLVVFFVGVVGFFALHFTDKQGAIVDLAVSCFGLVYVAVPMGMMIWILYFPNVDGRFWLAYLLIVTKIADVGAYFCGNLMGKRKLAPQISPGKTIEGACFGLICSILASYGFSWFLPLDTGAWVGLGIILGIVGQFGDLAESLLKRDANKKDSNALPGLGGGLDAIDSLLLNAPIVYLYLNL